MADALRAVGVTTTVSESAMAVYSVTSGPNAGVSATGVPSAPVRLSVSALSAASAGSLRVRAMV